MNKQKVEERRDRMKSENESQKIELLFGFIGSMDRDHLKKSLGIMQDAYSQYQAIGILDATDYQYKSKDMALRLKRLEGIVNLIDILWETEEEMKKNNESHKESLKNVQRIKNILGG